MEVEAVKARLGFMKREVARLAGVPYGSVTVRRLYAGSAVVEGEVANCTEQGAEALRAAVRSGHTSLVTVLGALADTFSMHKLTGDPALQQALAVLIVVAIAAASALAAIAIVCVAVRRGREAREAAARAAAMKAREDPRVEADANAFVISGGVLHFKGVPLSMLHGDLAIEGELTTPRTSPRCGEGKTNVKRDDAGANCSEDPNTCAHSYGYKRSSRVGLNTMRCESESADIVVGIVDGASCPSHVLMFTDVVPSAKVDAANEAWGAAMEAEIEMEASERAEREAGPLGSSYRSHRRLSRSALRPSQRASGSHHHPLSWLPEGTDQGGQHGHSTLNQVENSVPAVEGPIRRHPSLSFHHPSLATAVDSDDSSAIGTTTCTSGCMVQSATSAAASWI